MQKNKKILGMYLSNFLYIFYMFCFFYPGTHSLSKRQKNQVTLCINFTELGVKNLFLSTYLMNLNTFIKRDPYGCIKPI